ncbi:phospholipase D/nuclease [Ascobolus immersus RN42]|uniref:Phospholipase D/nuclease n=1 Tax=Ascobolus immersus RN42 TaxID=1160509 RepID=A0A3N4IM42_ASCIM|nr:phospholipase D/nuclease [Ascobolus immersus RN42]
MVDSLHNQDIDIYKVSTERYTCYSTEPRKKKPAQMERDSNTTVPDDVIFQSSSRGTPSTPSTPSMNRDISPPPLKRRKIDKAPDGRQVKEDSSGLEQATPRHDEMYPTAPPTAPPIHKSPFILTSIRDLPASANKGCISLRQLIGDPWVTKLWCINYLIDVDFIYENIHPNVRDVIDVVFIHGSWKEGDRNKKRINEGVKRHRGATVQQAWMNQAHGVQHSKLFILERADETIEVVIHTANAIPHDWTNMTNAIWRSYPLPKRKSGTTQSNSIGQEFQLRLIDYLKQMGKATADLHKTLSHYDFSAVKARFIGTVPSPPKSSRFPQYNKRQYSVGHEALRDYISQIPSLDPSLPSRIVLQCSSFPRPRANWLKNLFSKFLSNITPERKPAESQFLIVWPTPDEIRSSLNGYVSGTSIHMPWFRYGKDGGLLPLWKEILPFFAGWASSLPLRSIAAAEKTIQIRKAQRGSAAPHIKTFIKFVSPGKADGRTTDGEQVSCNGKTLGQMSFIDEMVSKQQSRPPSKYSELNGTVDDYRTIEYALLTSANLSPQAWGHGSDPDLSKDTYSNYEAGVLIYHDLFRDGDLNWNLRGVYNADEEAECAKLERTTAVRVPYDVPLRMYSKSQAPWSGGVSHHEPDVWGRMWEVDDGRDTSRMQEGESEDDEAVA